MPPREVTNMEPEIIAVQQAALWEPGEGPKEEGLQGTRPRDSG